MGDDKSTKDLIKDLILLNQKLLSSNQSLVSSVATLKKDITALKTRDKQLEKRPRNDKDEEEASHDGDRHDNRDSDIEVEDEPPEGTLRRFTISEEGEAFLETVFGLRLEYVTRKAKMAKYGQPNSKWTMCPELSPVVVATLLNEAIKNDKVAFRAQQLWMEVTGPLTTCLEKAHSGELTVQDVRMIRAALLLMGDAAQNHAALRRKAELQHLNPQLQPLMKESDLKGHSHICWERTLQSRPSQSWRQQQHLRNLCTLCLRVSQLFGRPLQQKLELAGWQSQQLQPWKIKEGATSQM